MNGIDLQDYEENVKKMNVVMDSATVTAITSLLQDAQVIDIPKKSKVGHRECLLKGFKEYILLGRIGMRSISPAHARRGFLFRPLYKHLSPIPKKVHLGRHERNS